MARKKKIEPYLGIRRRPDGKCKPTFTSFEEADEAMGHFTYPQDYEIVNLGVHPELIEK
jgi:hypothetical protein